MRNPFTRLVAVLGLIMIGAIAYQVAIGELAVEDAAIRAGITLIAVIVIRRLTRIGLGMIADSMERPALHRRRDDQPGEG